MGNRLGGPKQKDIKTADAKKRDKECKKDENKTRGKDEKGREKRKKRQGVQASELDTDLEDSSHVTGGDSESCVFHSAENVSISPYLDSCTRSELEHGETTWSGMFENYPSSQHPQVLSSRDFKDGFSLEACIPPEIARPEIYDEMSSSTTSRLEGRSSSSVKSRRSNNSVKSSRHATPTSVRSQHGDDASLSSQVSAGGAGGYSTPLLSTPVFGRTEHASSPAPTLSRVQETHRDDKPAAAASSSSSSSVADFHHPHFRNHRPLQHQQHQQSKVDFRNLPKPSSPHPQRRALSPKMASSPFKMISSDDSSSSPSTPIPQRKAANLLDLFRPGSKNGKGKNQRGEEKAAASRSEQTSGRSDLSASENETKVKGKPLWKTWERSSSKKTAIVNKTASIFGTARKTASKKKMKPPAEQNDTGEGKREKSKFEKMSGKINDALSKLDGDGKVGRVKVGQSSSSKSSNSSNMAGGGVDTKRKSSPPVAKSAAFCIMKLEELERSIEKTIREKFPDAEPLLLRKRSREELQGSRSLPTTPSLKKKLYVARDVHDGTGVSQADVAQAKGAGSRLSGDGQGTTLYCDEIYESPPCPAMSPVVLRRFGTRTRHASISPKIPRAKTAALYNSPSELYRAEVSSVKKHVPQVKATGPAASKKQPQSPVLPTPFVKPLTTAQKSESKYDNVIEEGEETASARGKNPSPHAGQLVRQACVDADDSDEASDPSTFSDSKPNPHQRPVIVPTFSAVFGSVSPKLRRHLQPKDINGGKSDLDKTPKKLEQQSQMKPGQPLSTQIAVASLPSTSLDSAQVPETVKDIRGQPDLIISSSNRQTTSGKSWVKGKTLILSISPSESGSVGAKTQSGDRLTSGRSPSHKTPVRSVSHPNKVTSASAEAQLPKKQGEDDICVNSQVATRSDATTRNHSSDHVVFVSVATPPCRPPAACSLTSSSPEVISTVSNSQSAHAPGSLRASQSQDVKFAKDQTSGDHIDSTHTHISDISASPTTSVPQNTLTATSTPGQQSGSVLVANANVSSEITNNHEKTASGLTPSGFSDSGQSSNRDAEEYKPSCQPQLQHQQNGHKITVFRQALSQVISDMINDDKQQQLRQSSPASPDYGIKLVQPALAMVTTPTYEQPCLTLEEKTVRNDRSISLPSSPIGTQRAERDFASREREEAICESRSQEIQTDNITTADKSVDSKGLMESYASAHHRPGPKAKSEDKVTQESRSFEAKPNKEMANIRPADPDDSDGSEFLKMVLACKRTSGQKMKNAGSANAGETSEHVPPPSPTAMQQLIEEFREEEGEDSDTNEKKEIEMAMRKETEMKQFTEKIYKRLSDLLGSHSGDENDLDDDVFVDEAKAAGEGKSRDVGELLSILERGRNSFSSENDDNDDDDDDDQSVNIAASVSSVPSQKAHGLTQAKVLTIETSSSLTTTTTSESDIDDDDDDVDVQAFQNIDTKDRRDFEGSEPVHKRKTEPKVFVFPECNNDRSVNSDDARARRNSRECHSDDDVVAGRGIPDYYDDRPLWSRRQKPPGQLSTTMMAIRRRERRERWLKKRMRNKTDLLSTGSSDTGSEMYPQRPQIKILDDSTSYDYEEDEEVMSFDTGTLKNEMGSGILTSPKYSRPILPFFDSKQRLTPAVLGNERHESLPYRERKSESHSDDGANRRRLHPAQKRKKSHYDHEETENANEEEDVCSDEEEAGDPNGNRKQEDLSSSSNLAIPGIEETFNELASVQNILEGLQDRTPTNEIDRASNLMPLTTENVKSIREYYKDSHSSGNGRRSRLSATDRTESDLDIYSEIRDDASSDSNMYADDEEDDDGLEPYATADDDVGATGGSSSAADGGSKCGHFKRGEGEEDSEGNFVVSCTFYNSNAFAQTSLDNAIIISQTSSVSQGKTTPKSASAPRTPTTQTVVNSDEEFWGGSVAIEESYRQLENAADAVSTTFQNAREQMHDIQHHLQALRRQMEVLQDDLSNTSMTLTTDLP